MPPAKSSLLFITCKAPWASAAPAAAADAIMTAGVFDQDVRVAFCGDGVWQLVAGQDAAALGHGKSLAQAFPALELYGITRVYADAAALASRGIAVAELVLNVQLLDAQTLQQLIAASDKVLVF